MKRILISGASGFIAREIAAELSKKGHECWGISRQGVVEKPFVHGISAELGNSLPAEVGKIKSDCFIHCAYDRLDYNDQHNTRGTVLWAEQAKESGILEQFFISSISAGKNAKSVYGIHKYQVEQWMQANHYPSIRLGLVIGDGGIFKNLQQILKKSPLFPLIDRGRTNTYMIAVIDVADLVGNMVENSVIGLEKTLYNFYQPQPLEFKDIIVFLKKQHNFSTVLFPLPYWLLNIPLWIFEKIPGISLPVNRSNIEGLRQSTVPEMPSDFIELGYFEKSLAEMVNSGILNGSTG
jgi:nucleoside-diphosphate-sugar epimerase